MNDNTKNEENYFDVIDFFCKLRGFSADIQKNISYNINNKIKKRKIICKLKLKKDKL